MARWKYELTKKDVTEITKALCERRSEADGRITVQDVVHQLEKRNYYNPSHQLDKLLSEWSWQDKPPTQLIISLMRDALYRIGNAEQSLQSMIEAFARVKDWGDDREAAKARAAKPWAERKEA